MLTETYTLPLSGKIAVVRGMTGHEEDLLTNKKLMKTGKSIDKLLTACTVELDGKEPTELDIVNLTSPDRTFLLVKIRELSYGEIIENAEIKCRNTDCNHKMYYDIDLTTLQIREAEEKDPDKEFEVTLPVTGTTVKFRYMKGTDELKLVQFGQDEILTVGMLLRLTDVPGENPNSYKKWLKNLPVKDRSALRKAMEKADEVGIDTTVIFTCDECGTDTVVRVESLPAFFFPEM